MFAQIRAAVISIVLLTLLTGLAYPLVVWGIAQAVFPHEANGSLMLKNDAPIGSELIGQNFDDPRYFWGRLSATAPMPYNAAASSGSNDGPLNPALFDEVKGRIDALRAADPTIPASALVPVDLVTSSGSGLDPDISPAAAYFQVHRVAQARGLSDELVSHLVAQHVQGRQFQILGEKRVNVLELNMELDSRSESR